MVNVRVCVCVYMFDNESVGDPVLFWKFLLLLPGPFN